MEPLTPYEISQVEAIAAWKSERPSYLLTSFHGLTQPLTRLVTKVIPQVAVRKMIEAAETLAETHDSMDEILKDTGLNDFRALTHQPLEVCDRLTEQVSVNAEHHQLMMGVVPALGSVLIPGVGGLATAVFDIPILFEASLRSIRRIGHCYGYPLDSETERLVLGPLGSVSHQPLTSGNTSCW